MIGVNNVKHAPIGGQAIHSTGIFHHLKKGNILAKDGIYKKQKII